MYKQNYFQTMDEHLIPDNLRIEKKKSNTLKIMLSLLAVLFAAVVFVSAGAAFASAEDIQDELAKTGKAKLSWDVEILSSPITIDAPSYKFTTVTLDLNGYTIQGAKNFNAYTRSLSYGTAIIVGEGMRLILIDSSHTSKYEGTGKIIGCVKNNGTLTIEDGIITEVNNNKDAYISGTVTMKNGCITNSVSNIDGTFTMEGGKITGTVVNDGSFILKDGVISGHCITNNGDFTLKGGSITNSDNSGILNKGTLSIEGGSFTNCSGENGGAVKNYGTVTMSKGSISDCKAQKDGGAIYNNGLFTLSGGTITNCSAENGGAIAAYNEDSEMITKNEFVMSGGSISECSAIKYGGAIYATEKSNVSLSGGSITQCKASNEGGGYYSVKAKQIKVAGNVQIKDNVNGMSLPSNVYLRSGDKLTIDASVPLTDKATIGISMGIPGEFTNTLADGESTKGLFSSDNPEYGVILTSGNKLSLSKDAAGSSQVAKSGESTSAEPTAVETVAATESVTVVPTEMPPTETAASVTQATASSISVLGLIAGLGAVLVWRRRE